jgi:enoyl-CoA hydratase
VVLTGDHRVGAAGPFKLGLNEVSIGMPIPTLAMELARDRLTAAELPRATLMAQIYDPEAAVRAGYLDAVAPPEALLATALAEAARLGALSRSAYDGTKVRLRGETIRTITSTLEADLQALVLPTA